MMKDATSAALPPVTKWFAMSQRKPWEPGAYQVKFGIGGVGWSFWDGARFLGTCDSADEAEPFGRSFGPTTFSIAAWRGLAANPNPALVWQAPVTTYVVKVVGGPAGGVHSARPAPRYIHETWAEAARRVPALAGLQSAQIGSNASQVFTLADTLPGYELLTYVGGEFVFRRAAA